MSTELFPLDLTWSQVDPRLHPFDAAAAPALIRGLDPAGRVPVRPRASAGDPEVIAWSHGPGQEWTDDMTRALVRTWGPWATGWRWAHAEGSVGGGPVGGWCCPKHSFASPTETVERVSAALCEWRDWLEDLAERFDRYPLDGANAQDRQRVWERATTHLVSHVVARTYAGDVWYFHCEQVLTWFLTRWGVDRQVAVDKVEQAVGGRFESWVGPDPEVLDEVAERLATSVEAENEA